MLRRGAVRGVRVQRDGPAVRQPRRPPVLGRQPSDAGRVGHSRADALRRQPDVRQPYQRPGTGAAVIVRRFLAIREGMHPHIFFNLPLPNK